MDEAKETPARPPGARGAATIPPRNTTDTFVVSAGDVWAAAATSVSGTGNNRGQFWAIGSPGYTYFKTIVTPNSTKHPWSSRRTDGNAGADFADFINANSNHSGGVNVAFRDGLRTTRDAERRRKIRRRPRKFPSRSRGGLY